MAASKTITFGNTGTLTLTKIPRYASVTQSLVSKTETTATLRWTSDSAVDYIWYSINNGSTWSGINVSDGTSGTYTINGLTADTTYQVKTRVRNKSSQLTTDSSALAVTTYAYPYASSMPSFTIGEKLTIGFYNPLGRSCTVNIIGADGSTLGTDIISGTTISGYNNATVRSRMYASIPNAQSGMYSVSVTYSGNVSTKTGGTYRVDANVCKPSIASAAYQDTNSFITAITGNAQQIVQGRSTVRYTASGLTANNSATIRSCSVKVNGNTYNLTVNGTSASGGNAVIDSAQNVQAVFTVTDSRGLTASKTITINILALAAPSAVITMQRQDNYYTATNILVNADYSSVAGKNTIAITYAATKDGDSSASVSGSLSDGVQSTVQLDNRYAWSVKITLKDRFGMTTAYTHMLSRGMPIIYFDRLKSSVGINCFPQGEESLEVSGVNLAPSQAECTIASGWQNYTSGDTPKVYKSGGVVFFSWVCKPTEAITLNTTQVPVCTIPVGYRPKGQVTLLCQGSGTTMFYASIDTSGVVQVSRLRDVGATGYIQASTSSWFPISATFVC